MHFSPLTSMLMRRLSHPPLSGHPNSHEQNSVVSVTIYDITRRVPRSAVKPLAKTAWNYHFLAVSCLSAFVVNGESSVPPWSVSSCQNSYVSLREPLFNLCQAQNLSRDVPVDVGFLLGKDALFFSFCCSAATQRLSWPPHS
jgi:hypothetical protein